MNGINNTPSSAKILCRSFTGHFNVYIYATTRVVCMNANRLLGTQLSRPAAIAMVTFTARRSNAEMVMPARPTPRETKTVSDMDDHPGHLVYIPLLEFFRCHNSSSRAVPPARAVKAALAEALVWYYPVAGRLREIAGGKLVVDCTAEGVAFVEADADVRLEELGEPLLPPFPCVEELLCDAGDIGVVVGKPIVFLQV